MSLNPAEYVISIIGNDAQVIGRLGKFKSANFIPRFNDVGQWSIVVPTKSQSAELLTAGNGISVVRNGKQIFSGPVDSINYADLGDDNETYDPAHLNVSGFSNEVQLSWKLAWPNPGGSPMGGDSPYDIRTGPQETIMLGYIRANCVETLTGVLRGIPYISVPNSGNRGVGKTYKARFENLLTVLQKIGGYVPGSGFGAGSNIIRFQLVWRPGSYDVVMSQPDPSDITDNIFSKERGNLGGHEYSVTGPKGTFAIAAGSGTGTDRLIAYEQNVDARIRWGVHREIFVDSRGSTTMGDIQEVATEAVEQNGETFSLNADLLDTATLRFGVDYDLGDHVRIELENGVKVDDIVTQVTYNLAEDAVAEAITPVAGDWTAQDNRVVQRAVKQLVKRMANLETI